MTIYLLLALLPLMNPHVEDVPHVVIITNNTPPAIAKQLHTRIDKHLSHSMHIVAEKDYFAAAKRAKKSPKQAMTPQVAGQIGPAVHASHVVLVTMRKELVAGHKTNVLDVAVWHLTPKAQVIAKEKFKMPKHGVTTDLTNAMVDFLHRYIPVEKKQPAAEPQAVPQAQVQSPNAIDAQKIAETPHQEQNANQVVGRSFTKITLGLPLFFRTGSIASKVQGNVALSYNNKLFNNVAPGIFFAGEFFLADTTDALGAYIEASLFFVSTVVDVYGTNETLHSDVLTVDGGLAYRIFVTDNFLCKPFVGYWYWHFPLDNGVFPGLAYNSPLAGLELAYRIDLFESIKALWLSAMVDYLALVNSADNAFRLGKKTSAYGIQTQAKASINMGAIDAAIVLQYNTVDIDFSGTTSLFTAQQDTNVHLKDQFMQLMFTVGGSF